MSSNIGELFATKYVVAYSSVPETAMTGVSAYPASAAYLDVSPYERVHIIASFGTIHGSDSPVLTPKQTDSVSGTLDAVDSTTTGAYTPNVTTGDNLSYVWTIEVADLATDHHFVALQTSGTLTNGTYVHVVILGEPKSLPATQSSSIVYGHYYKAGGQAVATVVS